MSTKEGVLAPAFYTCMVRSYSSEVAVVEAVEWSGVEARAVRGDALGILPSARGDVPLWALLG
jgi:hypothetical protein